METTSATSKSSPNQDKSLSVHSEFYRRLQSYSLFNAAVGKVLSSYEAAKSVPVLNSGLAVAEGAAQRIITAATPLATQVVGSLDQRFHLDERGVEALQAMEEAYSRATVEAEQAVAKAQEAAEETRLVAFNAYESSKRLALDRGYRIVTFANRPLNHILDVTEVLINRILPPLPEIVTEPGPSPSAHTSSAQVVVSEGDRLNGNPIPRARRLGLDLSHRVGDRLRLGTLSLTNAADAIELSYVLDLIQIAASYLDPVAEKARVQALELSKGVEKARDALSHPSETLASVREVIEERTEDMKESGVRAAVALAAALVNATETVRRRLLRGAEAVQEVTPSREELLMRLQDSIDNTKTYLNSLSAQDVKGFVSRVQEQSAEAMANLIALISAASSSQLLGPLSSWTQSIGARLGYHIVGKVDETESADREKLLRDLDAESECNGVTSGDADRSEVERRLSKSETEDTAKSEAEGDADGH